MTLISGHPTFASLRLTESSHNKFDLLKLPLELREAIYEMVLASVDSCPIINANKRLEKLEVEELRRYEGLDCPCEERKVKVDQLDISLLLTCKQVYAEAINVLHKKCTFKTFVKECFDGLDTYNDDEIHGYVLVSYQSSNSEKSALR